MSKEEKNTYVDVYHRYFINVLVPELVEGKKKTHFSLFSAFGLKVSEGREKLISSTLRQAQGPGHFNSIYYLKRDGLIGPN